MSEPGPAPPARDPPRTGPLSYPAFRVLWLAGIVSFIGSNVQNVGEAWLMMELSAPGLM